MTKRPIAEHPPGWWHAFHAASKQAGELEKWLATGGATSEQESLRNGLAEHRRRALDLLVQSDAPGPLVELVAALFAGHQSFRRRAAGEHRTKNAAGIVLDKNGFEAAARIEAEHPRGRGNGLAGSLCALGYKKLSALVAARLGTERDYRSNLRRWRKRADFHRLIWRFREERGEPGAAEAIAAILGAAIAPPAKSARAPAGHQRRG